MKRREFLKAGTSALAAQLIAARAAAESSAEPVKTVYVVAKCHLDLGFTDFERKVIQIYFDDYIPTAIETARKLKEANGEERYVWTLAAWMVYEYLERASPEQRKNMEKAIGDGDIAWHAMPFTWDSEMLDRSLMQCVFGLSKSLDRRFGITTIAAKLTDVPGHTRSIIGPLTEAGVQFLDVGANVWPPDVPPEPHLFNWRDAEGAELTVLYHRLNYGGTAAIPGTGVAVAINVRNDNSGPHSIGEIKDYYAVLRKQFPHAKIVATNLNTVAKAIQPAGARLPRVTEEIGDVWIYGAGSDPGKVARYRELSRLRREWLSKGVFRQGDAVDLAFSSKLILAAEHNWGLDTGTSAILADAHRAKPRDKVLLDFPGIYTPDELAPAQASNPVFQRLEASWAEKRADLDLAVQALPRALAIEASERLHALTPFEPASDGFTPHPAGEPLTTEHFTLALDAKTGAIIRLLERGSGREWASPAHPMAMFSYQMFSDADCRRYVRQFAPLPGAPWVGWIWGKPGLEKYAVASRIWMPAAGEALTRHDADGVRILVRMGMPDPGPGQAGFVGWPRRLALQIFLPGARPEVHIELSCFEKRANRLPEAMWFSFSPEAPAEDGWQFEKVNRFVSPRDVMSKGGRHLHAVTRYVRYQDERGSLQLETLDAPLMAPGQRKLTDFDNSVPEMREGVHCNLYNNVWNTAFPQWYGEDMRFRFIVSFGGESGV